MNEAITRTVATGRGVSKIQPPPSDLFHFGVGHLLGECKKLSSFELNPPLQHHQHTFRRRLTGSVTLRDGSVSAVRIGCLATCVASVRNGKSKLPKHFLQGFNGDWSLGSFGHSFPKQGISSKGSKGSPNHKWANPNKHHHKRLRFRSITLSAGE